MARSHVVVGIAAWLGAAPLLNFSSANPAYLGLAVAGSLLPDVDHPGSWVGRRSRPVSTAIASVFGHRGITHSALAIFALVALLTHVGFARGAISAVTVGYLSHLAADFLTPRGLRLAWPLRGTIRLPLCRTGSPMETLIVMSLVGAMAWWMLRGNADAVAALVGRLRHRMG